MAVGERRSADETEGTPVKVESLGKDPGKAQPWCLT